MPERDLNQELAEILTNHGITVTRDNEFIYADLPIKIKLKARSVYEEINGHISSQLDVMVIGGGFRIVESFGDIRDSIDEAFNKNFENFCRSSLHPLLAVFGSEDPHILKHFDIEQWEVNNITWTAYIGNLTPKTDTKMAIKHPGEFFDLIESTIRAQKLSNDMHWFRGFYLQYGNEIKGTEFMMDNETLADASELLSSIPIVQGVNYYSLRNFIILKRNDSAIVPTKAFPGNTKSELSFKSKVLKRLKRLF